MKQILAESAGGAKLKRSCDCQFDDVLCCGAVDCTITDQLSIKIDIESSRYLTLQLFFYVSLCRDCCIGSAMTIHHVSSILQQGFA